MDGIYCSKGSQSFQILHINTHTLAGADAKNKTPNLQETIWGKQEGEHEMDKTYGPKNLNKQSRQKGQPSLGLREKSRCLGRQKTPECDRFSSRLHPSLVLRKVNFKRNQTEKVTRGRRGLGARSHTVTASVDAVPSWSSPFPP